MATKAVREVPLEGGYGWFVVIASGTMMMIISAPLSMFSIIFKGILESNDDESARVTTVISFYMASQAVASVFMQQFLQCFSYRPVAITGAILFIIGNLLATFSTNFPMLLFGYGILMGFGGGMTVNASFTNIVEYFERLRTVAIGLSHTINVIGSLIYPLFIYQLIDLYGRFGAQLFLAGIGINILAGALLLHPDNGRNYPPGNGTISNEVVTRKLLLSSERKKSTVPQKWFQRLHFDHLNLLRQPSYLNLSLVSSIVICVDSVFFSLHPIFLLEYISLPLQLTTHIIAVTAAGDLFGRTLLTLIGKFIANRNRQVFLVSMICSGATIAAMPFVLNQNVLAVFSFILGVGRGTLQVSFPLNFAERYNVKLFPAALGLSLAISGVFVIVLGPLIGIIQSFSGSFTYTFLVIAAIFFTGGMLWMLEWWYISRRK